MDNIPIEKKKVHEDLNSRNTLTWGNKGQMKLQNTKLLLIGMTGASQEILRIFTLSGIGAIYIHDKREYKQNLSGILSFHPPKENSTVLFPSKSPLSILSRV